MPVRVLSLGAGVQSTTLALLASEGCTAVPDCAVFADTGWEPKAVYEHLAALERHLPFPVYRVHSHAGKIQDSIGHGRYEPIPWFIEGAIGRRQCTKVWKLYPIRRKVRELLGGRTPKDGCEMQIGISLDEAAYRCKDSTVQYIRNTWPLVDLRMNRGDCLAYLERKGWTNVPRSACCGCPYLSDENWIARRQGPEWADTVKISHRLAATGQYMHRALKPIDEIDFRTWAEKGQPDLFGNECEGMCGS
jgi:hypothetical protein